MSASNLLPTSYATIKRWEEASASLMAAFNHYVDTCTEIGTDPLSRFVRPEDLGPRVDSVITTVHAAISDQLPKATATLLRTRNILESPVLRFPKEILLEIFMSFIFDYNQGPQVHIPMKDSVHQLYVRLYTLCVVCSAWRDIVMSRGELWSMLPLGSRQDTWNPEAFYRSLQRAGASRLHLAAHDDGTEYWKDAFMQLMSEHGPRLRTVNLVSNDLKRVRGFVRTLLNHVATGPLSELSIKTQSKLEYHPLYELDDDRDGERDLDGYIFPGNTRQHSTVIRVLESLTAFRISGVRVNWNNVSFSSRLVELQIWNITLGYDNTIVTFLQSLSSAPELRDLHIIRVHTFRDQSASIKTDTLAPVVFPTLKTLFLQGLYFNTFKLISSLIAPGQYRVTLQFDYRFARIRKPGKEIHPYIYNREYMGNDDCVEAFDAAELSAALGRVQADTLRLEGGFHLRKALLRRVLRGLPGLKTLVLYDWVFDANDQYRNPDDFWRDSPRDSLPDDKIPALENLILVSCQIYLQSISSFLHMVASHPLRRINFFNTYVGDRNDERYNHLYIADSERSRKIVKMIEWLRNKIPEVRMVDDYNIKHCSYYYQRRWELW